MHRFVIPELEVGMAGFDHKCPYCDKEIEVHRHWGESDYSSSFILACDWCKRNVEVQVAMEPIFETGKPSCAMCSRAEVGDNAYYCNKCHKEILKYEGAK
jgi:hypothetical protein